MKQRVSFFPQFDCDFKSLYELTTTQIFVFNLEPHN